MLSGVTLKRIVTLLLLLSSTTGLPPDGLVISRSEDGTTNIGMLKPSAGRLAVKGAKILNCDSPPSLAAPELPALARWTMLSFAETVTEMTAVENVQPSGSWGVTLLPGSSLSEESVKV